MKRIIAIGSIYNNDDVAWRCVQQLESALTSQHADTEVIYCDSPGTQLIHLLQANIETVLIDALLDPLCTGEIVSTNADQLYHSQVISSHEISVAHVLQLAKNLNLLPDMLGILGIAIDPDDSLTDTQITAMANKLMQYLAKPLPKSNAVNAIP